MLEIYEEKTSLRFGAVDRTGRLSLWGAFDYFQEAAIRHAEILGLGRAALAEAKQAWILSRMSVLMERRPKQGEAITVRTWPRGSQKLFFIRDYALLDASGKPAVRAKSGWVIFDIENKRPMRPEGIIAGLPRNEGRDALPEGPAALSAFDVLLKGASRQAAYSDIDANGHVNNARYIQWIEDALPPDFFYGAPGFSLDINYLSEVTLGETVSFWTGRRDGRLYIEGRREDSPCFRAELEALD
jgi:acyl-ACP thioesterase